MNRQAFYVTWHRNIKCGLRKMYKIAETHRIWEKYVIKIFILAGGKYIPIGSWWWCGLYTRCCSTAARQNAKKSKSGCCLWQNSSHWKWYVLLIYKCIILAMLNFSDTTTIITKRGVFLAVHNCNKLWISGNNLKIRSLLNFLLIRCITEDIET